MMATTAQDSSNDETGSSDPFFDEKIKPVAIRMAVATATHPLDYVKVLVQIGHEPIAPRHTTTLLGKPALALPSVFKYIGHIKKREGILGLFSGLPTKLVSISVEAIVKDYIKAKLSEFDIRPAESKDDEDEDTDKNTKLSPEEKLQKNIIYQLAEKLCVLVITHPFHVLTIRTMAQFVGGEHKYTNPFSGLVEIWRENGISGFWSGFIPRAIAESLLIGLTLGFTHLFNNYIVKDKELKKHTKHLASYVAGTMSYPFLVVSNCMAVSRSGLAAGYPPTMPFYGSWTDCWQHLKRENQLKRGSTLFFRYYTRPHKIVGGRVFPLDANVAKRVS